VAILDVIPDTSAVIFAVPPVPHARTVTSPLLTEVIIAALSEVTHVAVLVKSTTVPSVYVPKAVNCLVDAGWTLWAVVGVTAIDTSAAGVIVSVALFEVIPEEVAVIEVAPAVLDVANPFEPAALLIAATAVFDECHVAVVVIFCVE